MLKINPQYLGNLMAQDEETKSRLLHGNWKIRNDNSSLFFWEKISDTFSNYYSGSKIKYITCDAARYGRDFCVIMAWEDWEVKHISVLKKSDVHDIVAEVEWCREKFTVSKSNTLVDADGVGADTVKQGSYKGFHGGAAPVNKEKYTNLKTQCYYKTAEENVNIGNIKININNGNCRVDGQFGSRIKIGSKIEDIHDLITQDLRAIKRVGDDIDGKKGINDKDQQKNNISPLPFGYEFIFYPNSFHVWKFKPCPNWGIFKFHFYLFHLLTLKRFNIPVNRLHELIFQL